jgi:sugar phosphate isomerase/epimerase
MDPRSVGFDFDPGYAAQGTGPGASSIPLRLALSRIKMVTLRDFNWSKDSGAWKAVPCALGEGVVNFQELFAALARMRFVGPISIQQDYQPRNELSALRRDIDFAIKQRAAAYGG